MFLASRPSRASLARLLTGLLIGGLLAGCLPGNVPTGTVKKPAPRASASLAPAITPSDTPSAIPSSVVNPGTGVVSNNGSSLSGVVRVPNGLIGNNGGSFRVLANAPESPLANVLVRLVDAGGNPLKDAEQRPLTTMTDEQGRYGFSAALPAQQILVEVVLPENKGQMTAIAPYASGVKKADVGLISTLATTYIVEKYLKGLPDPVARLERLPASMEAETRAKTQTAFEGGTTAVPATLNAEAVVAAVEQLRTQSATLNQQLEAVKQVLLVAGQSDLGSGRRGTEVDVRNVGALVPGPNGTLYVSAPFDRRVWKLRADGILETAIGKGGTAVSATVAGLSGPDAGLGAIRHLAIDGKNRLIVVDDAFTPTRGNAFRLDTNGKLEVVWKGPTPARFVFPAGENDLLVFTCDDPEAVEDLTGKLWRVTPGQAPQAIKAYTGDEPLYLNNAESAGLDAAGHPWITTYWGNNDTEKILRLKVDPATGAMQVVSELDVEAGFRLDSRAQGLQLDAAGANVKVLTPDGTSRTLALPAKARIGLEAAALGTDEALYLAAYGKVIRVGADGQVTPLIGAGETSGSANATAIAMLATGIAVDTQGVVHASDFQGNRVVKIQNGQITPLYTVPAAEKARNMRFDAQGRLHVLVDDFAGGARLLRLDAAGQPTVVHTWTTPEGESPLSVEDFVIGADGAVYAATSQRVPVDPPYRDADDNLITDTQHAWVERLPLNGFSALEIDHQTDVWQAPSLAVAPDKSLYLGESIGGEPRLRRWTAAGITAVADDIDSDLLFDFGGMTFDAQGRLYVASSSNNVLLRFEATTKTFTVIAGTGGQHFTGSGVDNSIENPTDPTFDTNGNLYFSDETHKQIKRIPANQL